MVGHAIWPNPCSSSFPEVNDIFSDMLDVHVIIYLDDILVYSDDPKEHMFAKYSDRTDSTANQKSATSIKTLSTISDSYSRKTDSKWIPQRYKQSKIGPSPKKSRTYNRS